jgi:hypothetical protein
MEYREVSLENDLVPGRQEGRSDSSASAIRE